MYYSRMIELDQHEGSYLSICRHYRAILSTPKVHENVECRKEYLRYAVLYLLLSPYTNEQSDLLYRMLEDKTLEGIPKYKSLLELFKNQEIIQWRNLCSGYEAELRSQPVFNASEEGEKRWKHLKDRVVEHVSEAFLQLKIVAIFLCVAPSEVKIIMVFVCRIFA